MAGSLPHMAAIVDHGVDPIVDVEALLDVSRRRAHGSTPPRVRDAAHGARVTFSPKVFIPLTMLCRDKCGYCTFAKPPAHLVSPYLELDEVLAIARRGAELGCHEALFTLGEAPEARYPAAAAWLADRGYASTVDYLVAAAGRGARRDRPAPPRQRRGAHRGRARAAPGGVAVAGDDDRDPRRPPRRARRPARRRPRQDARRDGWPRSRPRAGPAVPFTTGILVGIGETRERAARRARSPSPASHERHGHVQEVIVQNFLPKPGTAMWRARRVRPPTSSSGPIAAARLVLDPSIHLQAPPNLSDADDLARVGRRPGSTTGAASPRSPPTT